LLLGELFGTVNWVLQHFAADPQWKLRGQLGFIAVLHTWTQRRRSLGTGLPSFTTSHSNYDSRYRDPNRDRDRNRRNCKAFDPDSDSDFDFDRTGAPSLELLG
jgi:hypothetical protein